MKKNVLKMAVATFVVGVTTVVGGHLADAKTINVSQGDTLSKIAYENNTTVSKIAQTNGISNINLIYVGQSLEVGDNVQTTAPKRVVKAAPTTTSTTKQQAPVQRQAESKPVAQQNATVKTASGSEQQAKEWIAQRESGGSYSVVSASGTYVGRYQLSKSYLNGDYSSANQERVAENYVKSRYGSWSNAKAHHQKTGWY
ncbi:LysM peptidoglycan-binding domain-containing protein [Listeria sp. PSOL-1]|uniref:aggregation-promoting factor n=1 Tax=Listeria sp. PSOL-1 TaxID=1844999 RepID=UPI001E2AA7A1|nr:LysM peptidoglycan-binding domain-containing protein [Listeria sp. PSOL-1]